MYKITILHQKSYPMKERGNTDDYPKKKAMGGYGGVCEGSGGFGGGMGGYGTRFSRKMDKFPKPTRGVN